MTTAAHLPNADDLSGEFGIAEVAATDALIDRLALRGPHLDDLDDDLVAALAVFAAEVDLNPVPVQVTRRALREQGAWPPLLRPDAAMATRSHRLRRSRCRSAPSARRC